MERDKGRENSDNNNQIRLRQILERTAKQLGPYLKFVEVQEPPKHFESEDVVGRIPQRIYTKLSSEESASHEIREEVAEIQTGIQGWLRLLDTYGMGAFSVSKEGEQKISPEKQIKQLKTDFNNSLRHLEESVEKHKSSPGFINKV